jgi:diguanylate cyclase (GGDEF)-like protein
MTPDERPASGAKQFEVESASQNFLNALFAISSQEGPRQIANELSRQMVALTGCEYCCIHYGAPGDSNLINIGYYPPVPDFPELKIDFLDLPLIAEAHKKAERLFLSPDTKKLSPQAAEFLAVNEIQVLIGTPLCAHDRTIGIVLLFSRSPQPEPTPEMAETLSALINHAGLIIDQAILLEKASFRAQQLEGLRRASLTVTSSLELNEVFMAVLESAMSLSRDAMDAHIFLYEKDKLVFAEALWADGSSEKKFIEPRQNGLTYRVARSGEPVVVSNVRDHELFPDPGKWGDDEWSGAIIGLPLKIGEDVVGVMNIAYQKSRNFESDELYLLGLLADQAAIAIDNARLHRIVREQSLTDPLTGISNRRAFDKHLNDLLEYAAETGGKFTMMMIDLNNFKQVNDTYGHTVGDGVLVRAALSLQSVIRGKDFLARYGGDEFAILLPETDQPTAMQVHDRLATALNEKVFLDDQQTPISLSLTVGIAEYPTHGQDFDSIVSYADDQLYRLKGRRGHLDN